MTAARLERFFPAVLVSAPEVATRRPRTGLYLLDRTLVTLVAARLSAAADLADIERVRRERRAA